MDSLSCAGHASALTALRLLRNYNHLLLPPDLTPLVGQLGGPTSLLAPSLLGVSGYHQHVQLPHQHLMPAYFAAECPGSGVSSSSIASHNSEPDHLGAGSLADRRRGEKRPIPDNQKDEKYFERRKRNNQAAKKSRDARKIREDQIALRACVLEHENASLRAHLAAAREETMALRSLLLRDKAGEGLGGTAGAVGAGGNAGVTQPDLATSTTTD